MAMAINGMSGGGGFSAQAMQSAQAKQSAPAQQTVQAPKIENEAKSSLLDLDKEQARMKEMQEETLKRVQEQTKEEMNVQERSAAAMGFGNKLQMQLMGTA